MITGSEEPASAERLNTPSNIQGNVLHLLHLSVRKNKLFNMI